MSTIVRPAFTVGQRVYHTTDPHGEQGAVQVDTHEGQVWVSILWDDSSRAFPYPSELIRPVSELRDLAEHRTQGRAWDGLPS